MDETQDSLPMTRFHPLAWLLIPPKIAKNPTLS
jgi:hypothetical protein